MTADFDGKPVWYDLVDKPRHYMINVGKHRLESWDILDALFRRNAMLWNAGKYLMRVGAGGKDNDLQDLKKCRQYLSREISRLEALEKAVTD